MEPETEIVSDAPVGRSRRRAVKKATEACADKSGGAVFEAGLKSAEPSVVVATAGEPVERRIPDEEIRELVVEKLPLNPRMVLCSFEEEGVKRVVRVWVGINKNFKPRMVLRAQPGATVHAPWVLIGRRPRRVGRW
jgi:hypothetical protein